MSEPTLQYPGATVYRTARNRYRCVTADEIRYWRIRTKNSVNQADGIDDWTGYSDSYGTEADAAEAARVKVGTVSHRDADTDEAIGWYTTAEPEAVPNPNHRANVMQCTGDILPGDRYIEYLGEAAAYQSGTRYCLPCGIAAWATID
ncbi:hypothetical protein ABN028_19595 [Actinopolymorpha sp. B17G11]|uniref:hypothetical protein n=1 Tax=Actinopolymorpha sp. B17G11 TaxID=3160861 RepID=UPI0032E4CF5C